MVSFYEGGENDTFEQLVFFRKNLIFCRNETDVLLSNEQLEENDPICHDNRMIQVGISCPFYFRLKNGKTGSQPLGRKTMQMLNKPFLEFNTNTKRIRIYSRGTKMGFENGFGPRDRCWRLISIKTHIRRRKLNSAEIWNTVRKYVSPAN